MTKEEQRIKRLAEKHDLLFIKYADKQPCVSLMNMRSPYSLMSGNAVLASDLTLEDCEQAINFFSQPNQRASITKAKEEAEEQLRPSIKKHNRLFAIQMLSIALVVLFGAIIKAC